MLNLRISTAYVEQLRKSHQCSLQEARLIAEKDLAETILYKENISDDLRAVLLWLVERAAS